MKSSQATRVNVEQVQSLLGGDDFRRLIDRLRKRMSRGVALAGRIQLSRATSNERAALSKLLGRVPTKGSSLTVDLDRLASILVHAKACECLEDAVTAIAGPVENERLRLQSRKKQWEHLWQISTKRVASNGAALRWIQDLKASGLLKRMACNDLHVAQTLVDQAVSIVEQVPLPAVRLAELAASISGDSHALDRGQPLGALAIRFARQIDESARWKSAAERREAWELLGVLCDELSAPVLVLNLRADSESLTGRALNLHASAGEPYRISVRQLRLHPPVLDSSTCGPDVFVCENPTVVDVAANKLGSSCRPLVCIDGKPKTAAHLLLDAVRKAGMRVRYHGDFDWEGIRIGNSIIQRYGAMSWRFNATDYAANPEKAHPLKGEPVDAVWDARLAEFMGKVGRTVHEESVLEALLVDLRREV